MMRTRWATSLLLALLMTSWAWAQTDAQGRALAWQLYEAYSAGAGSGSYAQFEGLFTRDPQMTRRAFVSTMEYATEIYQQDMEGAREAITFANELAKLIASQFGDSVPSALMQKLVSQDPSAMSEFARYAIALYPGYSSGPATANGPGAQNGPGGYSQGPGSYPGAYGPGGAYPGASANPGYNPGSNPGAYGPTSNPGAYADLDSEEDGVYGPDGNPYGPGAEAYGPAASPYGPGANPYGPGASPYGPGANPYGPGANPYGPGGATGPGASTSPFGPGASGPFGPAAPASNSSGPFRPANATGGPVKQQP